MSLFHSELDKILEHFSDNNQTYIRELVDFSNLEIEPENQYILLKCMQSIDSNSPQAKKDYIIDIFEKIFVRESPPSFYIVNEGEDFTLTVRTRGDQDFTGSELVIRNAENGNLLSPADNDGNSDKEQTIKITDISLSAGSFYKLNVLTEAPDGQGDASGDVLNLLDEVYMYVGDNVDTN